MKNETKIKICDGTFCSETLCGDCFWLDYKQPTKDTPTYYWCKRISTYRNPKTNTSCSHWNVND